MAIQPGQIHHQRYRFERLIGQGAFGAAWQGEQIGLHRTVAIKVIWLDPTPDPEPAMASRRKAPRPKPNWVVAFKT